MDDDPQETKVSLTAVYTVQPADPIGAAETAMSDAAGENRESQDLSVLFRDHYRTLFRVAYRITGSQSDAEDVLQTIFLRLVPVHGRRDLSPNPQGYLYRAAVNASLDLVRSRARRNPVSMDVMEIDQSPALSANPEEDLAVMELREVFRRAVAKLEGRAAAVFALRHFEGYDNRHIADVLGTSQMVVAVTLHRAKTRLRKEIGNYLEKHHEAQ